MAKSKFEYVKKFEENDQCLPNCWIVIRIDGRSFHRFSSDHGFKKPSDARALNLMNDAARNVMEEFRDIVISFGESDEYSFVFNKNTTQFSRRRSKLMSNVVSLFSASYVYHWNEHFPDQKLLSPPVFDGRLVLYPSTKNIRDYLSWRQADCHINHLYNTCFWALVQKGGFSKADAEKRLKGTLSAEKNEILFSEYGINYNDESDMFKKGSILIHVKAFREVPKTGPNSDNGETVVREYSEVAVKHCDLISDDFWIVHPHILRS